MKKRFFAFLVIGVLIMSFATPIMASENTAVSSTSIYCEAELCVMDSYEITPFTEMVQTFWRNQHGTLQFRLWSITNGVWLTDWINA